MNVVDATLLHVSVSVVENSDMCPYCDCDPCDCDWGLNELFEEGGSVASSSLAPWISGLIGNPYTTSLKDLRLPDFDSIFNSLGTGTSNTHARSYKGAVMSYDYKVGDLVNWWPLYSHDDRKKVWIIKKVFNHSPLDCTYYDVEITDGSKIEAVAFHEIKKLEEG